MSIHATVNIAGVERSVNLEAPISLAIPLRFNGAQPNAFGLPAATAAAFQAEGFIADTREGGSINCATVTLNPHGNGTHTECVGHIALERLSIADIHPGGLFTAAVITVTPAEFGASSGGYPAGRPDDTVVHEQDIAAALDRVPGARDTQAIVLRVVQPGLDKRTANWSGTARPNGPPYFSPAAMRSLASGPWTHLVTELPSVDREDDDGSLLNHRTWWGLPQDRRAGPSPSPRTITEMALVPTTVADGLYVLSLDIPAFDLDAAPSRPLLYTLSDIA